MISGRLVALNKRGSVYTYNDINVKSPQHIADIRAIYDLLHPAKEGEK